MALPLVGWHYISEVDINGERRGARKKAHAEYQSEDRIMFRFVEGGGFW